MDGAAWVDEVVDLDALLKDPLDMHVAKASRRTIGRTLMASMGWSDRLDEARSGERPPITDSTFGLFFRMSEFLAALRVTDRVAVRDASVRISRLAPEGAPSGVDRIAALLAMLDLGWGHIEITGGRPILQILDSIRAAYEGEMSSRLMLLLRRWERERWIRDSRAT